MTKCRKIQPGDIVRYLRDDNETIPLYSLCTVNRIAQRRGETYYLCELYGEKFIATREDLQLTAPPEDVHPGARVRIIYSGALYPCNIDWLLSRHVDPEILARFAYGDDLRYHCKKSPAVNVLGTVIDYEEKTETALVLSDGGAAYLVDRKGLSTYFFIPKGASK